MGKDVETRKKCRVVLVTSALPFSAVFMHARTHALKPPLLSQTRRVTRLLSSNAFFQDRESGTKNEIIRANMRMRLFAAFHISPRAWQQFPVTLRVEKLLTSRRPPMFRPMTHCSLLSALRGRSLKSERAFLIFLQRIARTRATLLSSVAFVKRKAA